MMMKLRIIKKYDFHFYKNMFFEIAKNIDFQISARLRSSALNLFGFIFSEYHKINNYLIYKQLLIYFSS